MIIGDCARYIVLHNLPKPVEVKVALNLSKSGDYGRESAQTIHSNIIYSSVDTIP